MTSGRALLGARRALVAAVACTALLGWGHVVCAQGTLSGNNTVSLSVVDFDPFSLTLSDAASLSYRLNRFLLTSDSVFASSEPVSQNFRLTAPWGDFRIHGGLSFSSTSFTRGTLSLAGIWEGVSIITTSTLSSTGSLQTPSYVFANALRVSGQIPELGRLAITLDVGGADTAQGMDPCHITFKRMRISLGNLSFCGGTVDLGLVFGCGGLEAEAVTWSIPLPSSGFNMRVSLRYLDLLKFQGASVSVAGGLCGLDLGGNFAFDSDWTFQRGAWSMSGPFFSGTLSSSTTFDSSGLVSQEFRFSYQTDRCSLVLVPTFEILSSSGTSLSFDIPSVYADLQWELICCDGVDLGALSFLFGISEGSIGPLALTYMFTF